MHVYQKDVGVISVYTADSATLIGIATSQVPLPAAFTGLRRSVMNHKARKTRPHALIVVYFHVLEGHTIVY